MITAAEMGASAAMAGREPSASAHEVIDAVEAHETDHDHGDRDDEVEQPRHDEDQDAGNEGNDRRNMGDSQRHGALLLRVSKLQEVAVVPIWSAVSVSLYAVPSCCTISPIIRCHHPRRRMIQ